MSDESLSPNKKKRKPCVKCKILNFESERSHALNGGFRRRAEFFTKRITDEYTKISTEKNFAKLHLCPEHYLEVKKLRKELFTVRRKALTKLQLADVKRAREEVRTLELAHAEKVLRLGPEHDFVFRAQLKLEHARRVLAQRLRRLKEIQ